MFDRGPLDLHRLVAVAILLAGLPHPLPVGLQDRVRLNGKQGRGEIGYSPPRAPEPIVVRSLADVQRILENARSLRRTPRTALDLDAVSSRDAARIQTRINLHAADCGCNAGSVTGAVALLAYAAYILVSVGSPVQWASQHLLVGTTVVIGSALAGKAFGIVHARLQLVGELERLPDQLSGAG